MPRQTRATRPARRARAAGLLAAGAAVVLSPVLLAGPAAASGTLPDEPPGGATCAPEIPATDCQQEEPAATPTPTPTPSPTKAQTTNNPTTIPTTGKSTSTTPRTLARTGATENAVMAAAGVALLATGVVLVVAGRKPVEA